MLMIEEKKILKCVKEIIKRDPQLLDETIDMLIEKGVRNGAYQDYALVSDILGLLGQIVCIAERKKGDSKISFHEDEGAE